MPRDLLARVWSPEKAAADARVLEGTVVSVVDGDTIRVRIGSRIEPVRYIGVNTPELDHPTRGPEPGAREAAETNAGLVQAERVRLELERPGARPVPATPRLRLDDGQRGTRPPGLRAGDDGPAERPAPGALHAAGAGGARRPARSLGSAGVGLCRGADAASSRGEG